MTKEEIIEMAKVAQLPYDYETGIPMWLDKLEIFTKLVAKHEREACAKMCEEYFERVMASRIRARGQE